MYESRIMKPVKSVLQRERRIRKSNRGGEFDPSTLNACMEISLMVC
jgi:hypothetical protein